MQGRRHGWIKKRGKEFQRWGVGMGVGGTYGSDYKPVMSCRSGNQSIGGGPDGAPSTGCSGPGGFQLAPPRSGLHPAAMETVPLTPEAAGGPGPAPPSATLAAKRAKRAAKLAKIR